MAVTKSWNEPLVGASATWPAYSGVGEVEHRVGQVGAGRRGRCCRRACARGPTARPSCRRGAVALGHQVDHVVGQGREPAGGVEEAHRAGALGDEHVGRGAVALFVDEQCEVGRVAVADVDADPRLLGEVLEQRADEVLGAAAVDDEAVAVAAAAGTDRGSQGRQRDKRPDRPSSPAHGGAG